MVDFAEATFRSRARTFFRSGCGNTLAYRKAGSTFSHCPPAFEAPLADAEALKVIFPPSRIRVAIAKIFISRASIRLLAMEPSW